MGTTLFARSRERGKKDYMTKAVLDPGLGTIQKNGVCTVYVDQAQWAPRAQLVTLQDQHDAAAADVRRLLRELDQQKQATGRAVAERNALQLAHDSQDIELAEARWARWFYVASGALLGLAPYGAHLMGWVR